jgi:hypothetical protein
MFDLRSLGLMHWHGEDEWVPMAEGEHDAAAHDPEREWLTGARIFKCTQCSEEIAVAFDPRDDVPADHPHPAI